MVKTIDLLNDIILKNIPITNSVLNDYFGNCDNDDEKINIILGLYAGLITIKLHRPERKMRQTFYKK
jgi:hypothetical protein